MISSSSLISSHALSSSSVWRCGQIWSHKTSPAPTTIPIKSAIACEWYRRCDRCSAWLTAPGEMRRDVAAAVDGSACTCDVDATAVHSDDVAACTHAGSAAVDADRRGAAAAADHDLLPDVRTAALPDGACSLGTALTRQSISNNEPQVSCKSRAHCSLANEPQMACLNARSGERGPIAHLQVTAVKCCADVPAAEQSSRRRSLRRCCPACGRERATNKTLQQQF